MKRILVSFIVTACTATLFGGLWFYQTIPFGENREQLYLKMEKEWYSIAELWESRGQYEHANNAKLKAIEMREEATFGQAQYWIMSALLHIGGVVVPSVLAYKTWPP